MRRKDREITDYAKMLDILKQCDCCRLGLLDGDSAYIVPLNFGCHEAEGQLTLYFHGANEGKKIDLIKTQSHASFEMDRKHELVENGQACTYSYLYQCVMGKGEVSIVEDAAEKTLGLQSIMRHYSERSDWTFDERLLERVAVIKLAVTEWSCKEH